MEASTSRAEAERLLGISEKLLQSRDLNGSRDFAVLAQETEPLLDGSDQIIAVVDVLLAADRRVNNHHDWYSILGADPSGDDTEQIKRHYRRLALLLHPDKNRFPFSDHAFRLVAQAWSVLSDPAKKPLYDSELSLASFTRVDLASSSKLPVRRTESPRTFWTLCPYCYVLSEYPTAYEDCCLRCQRCGKAFQAVAVPDPPPPVPGQDAYHCCWAMFPMGFVVGSLEDASTVRPAAPGFPNWMPPMFDSPAEKTPGKEKKPDPPAAAAPGTGTGQKKRGRPRLH